MDLQSLIKSKSKNLKPSRMVITDNLGRKYEIVNGEKKELMRGLPFVLDEKPDMRTACIVPGLYLSSQDPATSLETLRSYNIKHILSIGVELQIKFDEIQYHYCELLDLPESNILPSLKQCFDVIRRNIHENILVHCNAGVSRSATIVISYLMTFNGFSYEEAFENVKGKRNCIKPNDGFIQQMKMLNRSSLLQTE